jgi:hypothetical protein
MGKLYVKDERYFSPQFVPAVQQRKVLFEANAGQFDAFSS